MAIRRRKITREKKQLEVSPADTSTAGDTERSDEPASEILAQPPKELGDAALTPADVFVQPSIDEGFGMTVFEALSFGLPVVVTENVGANDLLNSQVSMP